MFTQTGFAIYTSNKSNKRILRSTTLLFFGRHINNSVNSWYPWYIRYVLVEYLDTILQILMFSEPIMFRNKFHYNDLTNILMYCTIAFACLFCLLTRQIGIFFELDVKVLKIEITNFTVNNKLLGINLVQFNSIYNYRWSYFFKIYSLPLNVRAIC